VLALTSPRSLWRATARGRRTHGEAAASFPLLGAGRLANEHRALSPYWPRQRKIDHRLGTLVLTIPSRLTTEALRSYTTWRGWPTASGGSRRRSRA
jgi:hypothetical protein